MCARYGRRLPFQFHNEVFNHGEFSPGSLQQVILNNSVVKATLGFMPEWGSHFTINARDDSLYWNKYKPQDILIPIDHFEEHGVLFNLPKVGFIRGYKIGDRFVTLTCPANKDVISVHHRMPLIQEAA